MEAWSRVNLHINLKNLPYPFLSVEVIFMSEKSVIFLVKASQAADDTNYGFLKQETLRKLSLHTKKNSVIWYENEVDERRKENRKSFQFSS